MWKQPSLPGLEMSGSDTLFFAVQPDEDGALLIERLARDLRTEHGLRGRPMARGLFHVTLCGAGSYDGVPADVVARAAEAAQWVKMPPFEVVFDRAVSFRRRSCRWPFVLVSRDDRLLALRRRLGEGMERAGLGRPAGSSFTPHVTMLYDFGSVAERPVRPVGWTVSGFVLIRSLVGRSTHLRLGHWPLRN